MSEDPGRLIVVSNRLPVSTSIIEGQVCVRESTGGLATGMAGPHRKLGGVWIGWPGEAHSFTPEQLAALQSQLAERNLIPCFLEPVEVECYYNSFSNGVLWPLFHYLLDRLPSDPRHWNEYQLVNRKFADLVCEHYRPGDTIWVHDYQLMLLPEMMRERLPDARIGFFLHIPFPSTEVFRILPWRAELLRGLLGSDLVGFHTLSYARHFANCLIHILGLTPDIDCVRLGGRTVHFGAFPMGIDAQKFVAVAKTEENAAAIRKIRQEIGVPHILLGVDRLDYTKGLVRRLLAFERVLEKEPAFKGHVCFIQVAVPSRTDVCAYEEFTAEVHRLVGRINGKYGSSTMVPIHFIHRNLPQEELVALYGAADVMLVTPLRDGMNLVAKEYVASRVDPDGVLLLSEFAGAAADLGEALVVNPYDIDSTADTILRALRLSQDEKSLRMQALHQRVVTLDVNRWADNFVTTLSSCATIPVDASRSLGPRETGQLVRQLAQADKLVFLLDYDGTLVPFADSPELAIPDVELLHLFNALVANPGFSIHIISGRKRETLEKWFGNVAISLHAEHGLWSKFGPEPWRPNREVDSTWKSRALPILEKFCRRTPGSRIEEKSHSLAWHYRMCDAEFGEWQAKELKIHLTHVLSNAPVCVLAGDKVVELQPLGIDKGKVVPEILARFPGAGILAAGDDETDERLFEALPEEAVSLHIGPKSSRARFNLSNYQALRKLLRRLVSG